MNGLGAEIALTLELYDLEELFVEHLPGKLNIRADVLSRVWAPGGPGEIPPQFTGIRRRPVPVRDDSFYIAWDFAVDQRNK